MTRSTHRLLLVAAAAALTVTCPGAARANEHDDVTAPVSACAMVAGGDGLEELGNVVDEIASRRVRFGCEENTANGAKTLAAAKYLDVPADLQGEAPDCGYHAIRMVLKFWRARGEIGDVPSIARMRELGFGFNDGRTGPTDLVHIVGSFGIDARADQDPLFFGTGATIGDIRFAVAAGVPIAAVIQADEHGCPFHDRKGAHSHWIVIEGFTKGDDGTEYVVAKNPWSQSDMLWRLDDFERSWADSGHAMVTITPDTRAADDDRRASRALSLIPRNP